MFDKYLLNELMKAFLKLTIVMILVAIISMIIYNTEHLLFGLSFIISFKSHKLCYIFRYNTVSSYIHP